MAEMIRFQWVLDIYSIYKIGLYKFLGVVFPLHYQFDGKNRLGFLCTHLSLASLQITL